MEQGVIKIRGARVHNLKNIDVALLTVYRPVYTIEDEGI